MKIVTRLLILLIFLNVFLVFGNIFNPRWAVHQIDLWLETPTPQERLINQEGLRNTPPITINGEVKAVVEVESFKKN